MLFNLVFCSKCWLRKTKNSRVESVNRGIKKVDDALDIVNLIRSQKRLKVLEHVIFNREQRVLNKMNRWNYLRDFSSSSSDQEYPDPTKLLGYLPDRYLD